MPTTIGPELLGRKPSEPDHRDADFMAAAVLHKIRTAAPPIDDSILKLSIQKLYDKGYFRTQTETLAVFKWLKAHEQPPKPVPPSPKPAPTPPTPPSPNPTALRRQVWNVSYLLDQLQTGHCVGFGGTHWGISDPVNDKWTVADAHALYYACKVRDGEPGAEDGSSVRTLAQQLQSMGRLANYVWCATVTETGKQQVESVTDWLLHQGPVVMGTNWTADMFNPNAQGVIRPTGKIEGGHCYLAHGVDLDLGLVKFAQSWGPTWGVEGGHFYMSTADLQHLLDAQGEALATLELPLAA